MEKGYKKLFVWQKADELAYNVYIESKKFPKDEIYGITSQLRRKENFDKLERLRKNTGGLLWNFYKSLNAQR